MRRATNALALHLFFFLMLFISAIGLLESYGAVQGIALCTMRKKVNIYISNTSPLQKGTNPKRNSRHSSGGPCHGTLVRGGEESRGIDHRDDLSSLTSLGVMTRSLSISKMAPSFLCWPQ
jgi:hypothetical protein